MVASDWPRKDAAMMRSAAYCSSVKDLLILEILAIPISVSTSIAFATLSRKTQQKVFQGGIAGNRCDVSCPKACGPDAGGETASRRGEFHIAKRQTDRRFALRRR
jgi:hypothetical protein